MSFSPDSFKSHLFTCVYNSRNFHFQCVSLNQDFDHATEFSVMTSLYWTCLFDLGPRNASGMKLFYALVRFCSYQRNVIQSCASKSTSLLNPQVSDQEMTTYNIRKKCTAHCKQKYVLILKHVTEFTVF